jgi:hypothetical protein
MSEQDEVEVEVVEEQSSQNDRVKLEKSIRKDIFLAAKMAHHIMKNVEYLNKQGHNSASECANQTYLKVMDMATQVESYFSDKRKAKVVTSNQDASEVSKVDKQALEKRIKENMKESLRLLNALLLALKTNKEKVCAYGDPDPSFGLINETLMATVRLSTNLYEAFQLEEVREKDLSLSEIQQINSIPIEDSTEELTSDSITQQSQKH